MEMPPYKNGDDIAKAKCYMCEKDGFKSWFQLKEHLRQTCKVPKSQLTGYIHEQAVADQKKKHQAKDGKEHKAEDVSIAPKGSARDAHPCAIRPPIHPIQQRDAAGPAPNAQGGHQVVVQGGVPPDHLPHLYWNKMVCDVLCFQNGIPINPVVAKNPAALGAHVYVAENPTGGEKAGSSGPAHSQASLAARDEPVLEEISSGLRTAPSQASLAARDEQVPRKISLGISEHAKKYTGRVDADFTHKNADGRKRYTNPKDVLHNDTTINLSKFKNYLQTVRKNKKTAMTRQERTAC